MKFSCKPSPDIRTLPATVAREIREHVTSKLVNALYQMQRSIMDTPVYTGKTIANYRWSLGDPIIGIRNAINIPDLPGKTSVLPLGEEARRSANAGLVEAEFTNLLRLIISSRNPFQRIFLTNNVPNFSDVEYGTYSANARTPVGGIVRRGETRLQNALKGAL
jgi:hypothetical protein